MKVKEHIEAALTNQAEQADPILTQLLTRRFAADMMRHIEEVMEDRNVRDHMVVVRSALVGAMASCVSCGVAYLAGSQSPHVVGQLAEDIVGQSHNKLSVIVGMLSNIMLTTLATSIDWGEIRERDLA